MDAKTYVAEIKGEAVVAFRADDDEDAYEQVHGSQSEDVGIKAMLLTFDRADDF